MAVKENNPFSALASQIQQFLWASILLSVAVAAVSLVNMGRLSVFIAPIAFMFTLLHHSILLGLIRRDKKKDSDTLKDTLAPTSLKSSIILLWLLILLWVVAVLAVIFVSVSIMSMKEYEGWERFAGYLEIPFEVAEVCVLVILAFKCRKQRRNTLIEPSVDWQSTAAAWLCLWLRGVFNLWHLSECSSILTPFFPLDGGEERLIMRWTYATKWMKAQFYRTCKPNAFIFSWWMVWPVVGQVWWAIELSTKVVMLSSDLNSIETFFFSNTEKHIKLRHPKGQHFAASSTSHPSFTVPYLTYARRFGSGNLRHSRKMGKCKVICEAFSWGIPSNEL